MKWSDLIDRGRNLLCRWFGHQWKYLTLGDSRYWERTCRRCGREETNEPFSVRDRRIHADEYAILRKHCGFDLDGYFESAIDAAIEGIRRVR